jgi:threonine dehydratase
MIGIKEITEAREVIRGKILKTPLIYSETLSRMFECEIFLKLENQQETGSFKIRGALYKLMKRAEEIGPRGVVAASGGNHAQGVARAAAQAGIPATVVMPAWASITKQEATRSYGCEVIISGNSIEDSLKKARELADQGRTFIHPFDDEDVISGQGTIALEILEDLTELDTVLVPVGGGGLVSGISTVFKSIRPKTRIVGIQAENCPSAHQALNEGKVTSVESRRSMADGINVKRIGNLNFELMKKYVDEIALVDEEHIAEAILLLLERKKILAEGAGAVPLAAMLSGAVSAPRGSRVVLIISGGNLDSPLLGRIIDQGLVKKGRIVRLWVYLDDTPGSLARLLDSVARLEANVLHIHHDRHIRDAPLNVTRVELELETRSPEHITEIDNVLKKEGYLVEKK